MAAPNPATAGPTCAPCNDSNLSMTASIMGIITFTFAWILALNALFLQLARSAGDGHETGQSIQSTVETLQHINTTFGQIADKSGGDKDPVKRRLLEFVRCSIDDARAAMAELESLFRAVEKLQRGWRLRDRARFVFKRRQLDGAASKLDKAMEQLQRARENYERFEDDRWRTKQRDALKTQTRLIQQQDLRLEAMERSLHGLQRRQEDFDDGDEGASTRTQEE